MISKLKYFSLFLSLLCSLTLTGLSLIFAVFLTVHSQLRTQLYIYLTVLMPSGEAISLIAMLFCSFLAGAVVSLKLYKGEFTVMAIFDAIIKLFLSIFVVNIIFEIKLLLAFPIISAVYLVASIILAIPSKQTIFHDKQTKPDQ